MRGALKRQREDGGEGDDGGDVEDALPGVRRPDDEQDEGVGNAEFEDGARASEWLESHVRMDGGVEEWVANCSTPPMRDEAAHEWPPGMNGVPGMGRLHPIASRLMYAKKNTLKCASVPKGDTLELK